MTQSSASSVRSNAWSLEVVRGRDVGKVFVLNGAETVLGNALDGAHGVDLREQEGQSPRRMAGRQALLESKGTELTIRDLDSPGGTFVNRRRLLGGQIQRLQAGDEIQVGGVLLRVTATASATAPVPPPAPPPLSPAPAVPGRLPEPFSIGGTVACRSWDDFLVVAAQRWSDLRDELVSGRLGDYLRRVGRTELLPGSDRGRSDDERLDDWLGRLPVSRSAAPELDVFPDAMEVKATGGTTRHTLRITNVGYRLLRSQARIEPSGASWIRIVPPHDGRPFATIEATTLTVEITAPEGSGTLPTSEVVIDSNGGTRRIPVKLAPTAGPPPLPDARPTERDAVGSLAAVSVPARILSGLAAAIGGRVLVSASSLLPIGPGLPALAVVCGAIGGVLGVLGGWRRARAAGDAAMAGVAAGLAGVIVAALLHAISVTIDGPLGDRFPSIIVSGLAWLILGAFVAGVSTLMIPHRAAGVEGSR